jgi:cytochrome P450
MHGQYARLTLLSALTFFFRSMLHDPKAFNNPMEYDPERYLKDGYLNPDVMDPDSAAFGFGRRSVDPVHSTTYIL